VRSLLSNFDLNSFKYFTNRRLLIFLVLFELPILGYLTYFYSNYIYFFPVLIIFGLIFFYTFINFEFWILSSIVAYVPLVLIKSESISIVEVVFAFYIFVPLGVWFIKKIFIRKEILFKGTGDYLFLIFYIICLFSIIITKINDFETLPWFKETTVFSGYLLYFPLRDYFKKTDDGLKKVLISFGILSFITALYNLYKYRSKVALATQFFQVWANRVGATEQIFMFCILIIISIIFLVKSKKTQLLLLSSLGLFFISLVLSFTRSYLGFTFLGIFFIWFFFKKKEKIKLTYWTLIFSVVSIGAMLLLFDNMAKFIFQAVVGRFFEMKGRDISIIQRFIETKAIIANIFQSPIIGWGLGAKFRRYDLFYETHILSDYAHNAFLYLWYKLGIIGLGSFLTVYFEKLYSVYKNFRKEPNQMIKNILLVFIFILISFLFISITSPQFYHKPSILIMTIIWGYSESLKGKKESLLQ
jgi:O-antigen ligase